MENDLLTLLRKLPLNKQTVATLLPLLGRYGATGAVMLARGYLGPLARRAGREVDGDAHAPPPTVESDAAAEPREGAPAVSASANQRDKLAPADAAILGLALTKLVYELGELALHNPTLDPTGRQPEFKLDEAGYPPAMSVAHVLAAARLWREHAAKRDAEEQAKQAETSRAMASSPRAQLQAARSERYATTPRYSYVPAVATYRAPR